MLTPSDPIGQLLAGADHELQTDGLPERSSRPILIAELQRRASRRRSVRAVAVVATVVCAAMLLSTFGTRPGRRLLTPDPKLAASLTGGSIGDSVEHPQATLADERSLDVLAMEAADAFRTAKALQHQFKRESLRKEYVSLVRDSALVEPRSTLERAAQFRLNLAAELDRESETAEMAQHEYQQIVDEFPETTSAITARQCLAHSDS